MKKYIPNTITCLNLLSGCLAVVFAFEQRLDIAWLFIGAAAVFDFCDGAAARLLKAYSSLGKELDSLSDLVSFGLAPASMVYSVMSAQDMWLWPYVAFFITVMGALRLAKFNVDDRQATSFLGLPIPANAIFWIGFIAWCQETGFYQLWLFLVFIALTGLLMVSNIPMFSLKFRNFSLAENIRRYALIIGAILFIVFQGVAGLAWTILLYIILSLVKSNAWKEQA